MFYINDIELDAEGNTRIKDGDFVLTTDNTSFIQNMLLTYPETWVFHPAIGIGLDKYVGRINDEELHGEMRDDIKSSLQNSDILSVVKIVPVDNESIAGSIEIVTGLGIEKVTFSYNLLTGGIEILNAAPDTEKTEKIAKEIKNIYLKRR